MVLTYDGMDDMFRQKVVDESRERQALAHPCLNNIVECYNRKDDFGTEWHYIVSELAPGETLQAAIEERRKKHQPMHEPQLMRRLSSLALALDQTHAQGQLHRNISSAHVYLDQDGQTARLASHANLNYKEFIEDYAVLKFWGEHFYLNPSAL